jgi:hypothetical protein
MNKDAERLIEDLRSDNDSIRMNALKRVLELTESRVDWIYDVWDGLFEMLKDKNSFKRSIGIMVLCNLAKSDIEDRLSGSIDLILAHTHDEKFVTSRQCLQNIWKLALTCEDNFKRIISHLEMRFMECINEDHYNLLRQDIIQSMKAIYDSTSDKSVFKKARLLISEENETKYRKKYEAILIEN